MTKTMTLYRDGQILKPRSRAAALELERLPALTPLRVTAVKPRSGKHHRLVFAMLSLVAEALNNGPAPSAVRWDAESVLRNVKLATGHSTVSRATKRQAAAYGIEEQAYILVPASISFDRMDQTEFSKFGEDMFAYIRDELAPWLEQSPEWAEIRVILSEMGL